MPTPSHPTPPRPQQQPPRPQQQPAKPPQPHQDADKDKHHDDKQKDADKHRDPSRPDPEPPNQPQQHHPQAETPVAGVAPPEPGLPLGARPKDERDPQSAKFEAHAAPPRWDEPPVEQKPREEWTPEPALDARAQKPPQGYYADGMTIADEQRARAAWVEAHGLKAYDEATDQRPDDEKPAFDKDALAIGGAFVSAGAQKQVQGVAPPTKRPQPSEEQRR